MATNDAAIAYSTQNIHDCGCLGKGYVRVDVQLENPLFGQAIPCICKRDAQAKQKAARDMVLSQISPQHLNTWKFSDYIVKNVSVRQGDNKAATLAYMHKTMDDHKAYALQPTGWIVIQGDPGTGKTHLAYATAIAALTNGLAVYINTINDMLEDLRAAYSSDMFDDRLGFLKRVELLMIDDLGAQRVTDWASDTLYQIINYRYSNNLPLLVTTNVNIGSKDCGIEERVRSRLMDGTAAKGKGLGRIIPMPVCDYRPQRVTA